MRTNNNIYILFLSVSLTCSLLNSMEKPTSASSLRRERPPQMHDDFVTEYGMSLRAELMHKVAATIDHSLDYHKEMDSGAVSDQSLLKKSPRELVMYLYERTKQSHIAQLQSRYGIDFDQITAKMNLLHAEAIAKKNLLTKQMQSPSSPVEKAASLVQAVLHCSPLRIQKIKLGTRLLTVNRGTIAQVHVDGTITYIEDELESVAPSPASKSAILAHEKMHQSHNDVLFIKALEEISRERGIVLPSDFMRMIDRQQEVFAELIPCSISAEAAEASERVTRRMIEVFGATAADDLLSDHPHEEKEADLACLMQELHAEYEQEQLREEQHQQERRMHLAIKSRRMQTFFRDSAALSDDPKKADISGK